MKNLALISFFLFSVCTFAQISESFSDGDNWTTRWSGDIDKFTVDNEMLRSNFAPSAANTTYYISRENSFANDCEWRFFVNLKFSVSGSNYADIYLTSDQQNLKASNINAYFVRIGDGPGTTSGRRIALFKKLNGGTPVSIISSENNLVNSSSNNPFFIKVIRTSENNWTFYYNKTDWDDAFTIVGSVTDDAIVSSSYMGIYILQNATGSIVNNHFFDDFYVGNIIRDIEPPTVNEVIVESNNQLAVSFSETISPVNESNFSLSAIGAPSAVVLSADGQKAILTFANDLPAGNYILTMNNITDLAGNALQITEYQVIIPERVDLVQDDFSDGDFTHNPTWSGNVASFEVVEEDGNYMLRSANQTANARFYLSTPSSVASDCEWNFWVNLQFNTSGPNFVDYYLMSDKADLSAAGINGYFVRIGGSDDKISLFKKINGVETEIIVGASGVTNFTNNTFVIKVVRDADNVWTLKHDRTGTGNNFVTEGRVTDADILSSSYLGIYIAQSTSSFFERHFFDNIYAGPIIPDTTPPTVSTVSIIQGTTNQVQVVFSEPILAITPQNFSVSDINPNSAVLSADQQSVILTFAGGFSSGVMYTLSMNYIADLAGNYLVASTNGYQFGIIESLEIGDLVINEIMFINPDDADEYVEIYNTSNKLLDVSGLRITTQTTGNMSTGYAIPARTVILPNSYLGLVRRPDIVRSYYGLSDDIPLVAMPFPTTSFLNNTAATVFLTSNDRNIIYDQVSYQDTWHDTEADARGISLEKINPAVLARDPQNWQSATENVNFGTPGYENSRYQSIENIMPRVFSIDIIAENLLQVTFSKPIRSADFQIEGMGITPTRIDNFAYRLALSENLVTQRVYFLNINAVDFYNNWLEINEYKFGFPEAPEPDDLIFNEIMFNSADNSEDYIEIYNKSDKIIDLTGVSFMRITATTTPTRNIPAGTIIFPHDYLAFSAHPEQLQEQFNTPEEANIISLNLGSTFLPNDATIFLTNGTITFDELTYSDRWHSPLISNHKGVALERINPNLPTQNASNWHSAAWNVNFGTPGYKNSQFSDDTPNTTGKRAWAEPENFTPDNDGHNDITNIHFSTGDIGFFATVFIYDALGRKVRTLANNLLISPEAFIRWDGTDDNGQIVNVGIYAVYAEIIRTDGKREQFKFPCVVSAVKR